MYAFPPNPSPSQRSHVHPRGSMHPSTQQPATTPHTHTNIKDPDHDEDVAPYVVQSTGSATAAASTFHRCTDSSSSSSVYSSRRSHVVVVIISISLRCHHSLPHAKPLLPPPRGPPALPPPQMGSRSISSIDRTGRGRSQCGTCRYNFIILITSRFIELPTLSRLTPRCEIIRSAHGCV